MRAHAGKKVPVFSDSQVAIQCMEHLEPGPGQPIAWGITKSTTTLHEAGIETAIEWGPRPRGILRSKNADGQANLAREGCKAGIVQVRLYQRTK